MITCKRHGLVKDLVGRRFGRLIVLDYKGTKKGRSLWSVLCDCGNICVRVGHELMQCDTKSCGCLVHEKTHGLSKTSSYTRWASMHQRCRNKKHSGYFRYGGRGISVCKRWSKFEAFYADMGECPEGMSLDRIDNSKGYCLKNCRWADIWTQAGNTRQVKLIKIKGKIKNIAAWCRFFKLKERTVRSRLNRIWPIDQVFELSPRIRGTRANAE